MAKMMPPGVTSATAADENTAKNSIPQGGNDSQEAEIEHTLRLIIPPGQVTEIRALGVSTPAYRRPHIVNGYFDDLNAAAKAAAGIHAAKAVYFVPNPVNPALLARAANRLHDVDTGEPTTSDMDILARHWLLIDCDPVRPAGISSSEGEKRVALAKAETIRAYLRERGFPEPILADSGNGGHLMLPIDLPVDDGGLVNRVLAALGFLFGDEVVSIDQTVYNPARIWKLYGTKACKGDNTPDRPHRLARLLEVPEVMRPASRDLLESLASLAPKDHSPKSVVMPVTGGFDFEQLRAEHDAEMVGPMAYEGGHKWIFPECPWNTDHNNRAAWLIQFPSGALAAGCHHDSCSNKGWHDLRDLWQPGWRDGKRAAPAGPDPLAAPADPSAAPGGQQAARSKSSNSTGEIGITKRLADAILEWDHFAQDAGARLYVYLDGVYIPRGEKYVATKTKHLLEAWGLTKAWSSFRASEVAEYIRTDARMLWERPPLDTLNVQNGLLNVETRELRPHSPDFLSSVQLLVKYDPATTCPHTELFISTTFIVYPENWTGR